MLCTFALVTTTTTTTTTTSSTRTSFHPAPYQRIHTNQHRTPSRQVSARSPPTSSPQYIAPFCHPMCLCLRTYFHSLLAVHIPSMHCQYASCMTSHEHTKCTNKTIRTVAIQIQKPITGGEGIRYQAYFWAYSVRQLVANM